jgi:hypothetical protein
MQRLVMPHLTVCYVRIWITLLMIRTLRRILASQWAHRPESETPWWIGPKPAFVIPTGAGFVTIRSELEGVECPTANESDLDSTLTVAEWGELEDMSNVREYVYDA